MKKTIGRRTNIRQKITAVILSAVTACSVGTMAFAATAFAADNGTEISLGLDINEKLKITMDKDLQNAVNITSGVIFKVLEECTPWGKFVTPAFNVILGSVIGEPGDPTQQKLDEINDKLDRLFEKINAAEAAVKASIETDLGLQSFYETFVKFKSLTETMNGKIRSILNEDLPNAEKLAKVASLTGGYSEWRNSFEDILTALNNFFAKPSMTASGSVFALAYKHCTQSVMFSGEALDKAKPICDYLLQVYTAGCTTLIESLSAQLFVNCLTDETKATIPQEYMSHICGSADDIYSEINMISRKLVGDQTNVIVGFVYPDGTFRERDHKEFALFANSDGLTVKAVDDSDWINYARLHPELHIAGFIRYEGECLGHVSIRRIDPVYAPGPDTVQYMYNTAMNISRSILVNKGHNNIRLGTFLDILNHNDDPNANGKFSENKGSLSAKWFNERIGNSKVSYSIIKELAQYAKERNISIRTLLNENGFDTSNLPVNTNLVTANAEDKSTNSASLIVGYNYQQSFYKGVSIDDAQAAEKDIQVLDCGFNIWTGGEWGFSKAGYACRFA